jgi:hypothetical protein
VTWYLKGDLKKLPAPAWLIENYLLTHTLAQLSGPSKVGKTFLYVDWACRLACEGKRVALLIGEGLYGMDSRIAAWEMHHQLEVPMVNLLVRGGVAPLANPEAMAKLGMELKRYGPFDFMVFDTYARFMAGADENNPADTSAAMENVEKLREKAGGATSLLVTHFGWDGTRQRGSSALYGACDTVLYFVPVPKEVEKKEVEPDSFGYLETGDKPKSRRSRLTVDKHRDAPDEIDGVTFERTDVGDTGSCVYLPIKAPKIKAETNGHGPVIDITEKLVPQ